jgi:hypothetical protein
MRRLIAIAMLMILALPAMAAEDCVAYDITHVEHDGVSSPHLSGYDGEFPGFRTAIVGSFLWVEFGTDESTRDSLDSENQSSIQVNDPSITGVEICASDQSVAIFTAAPEPEVDAPVDAPELAPAVAITIVEPASYGSPLVS